MVTEIWIDGSDGEGEGVGVCVGGIVCVVVWLEIGDAAAVVG